MATYYLATAANGGSDSNNGTTALTPWLTINKLFGSGTSGSTCYVIGHASETFNFDTTGSFMPLSKNMEIRAYNLDESREWQSGDSHPRPVFSGTSTYGWYGQANVTVSVYNCDFDTISAYQIVSFEWNGNFNSGRYRFYYCNFFNFTNTRNGGSTFNGAGNSTSSSDPGMWFVGCKFWDITTSQAEHRFMTASYAGVNRMDNCTLYISSSAMNYVWYLQASGSDRVAINNCIIRSIVATQFTYSDTSGADTYNNVNKLAMSGVSTTYATNLPAKVTITSDPMFVDPTNNNFNLRPGSPCIGTGAII